MSASSAQLERARALVRRFYEELWNQRNEVDIGSILAPDVRFRGSLGTGSTGHAGFLTYVQKITRALEGYRCDEVTLVAEKDQVFARMRFSGRQRDTGEALSWEGAALFTHLHDRIVEVWVLGDFELRYGSRQADSISGADS